MYSEKVENYYLRDRLDNHNDFKQQLLSLIDNTQDGNLVDDNNDIAKLDYNNHADFDRPWVKLLLPILVEKLGRMVYSIGYDGIIIKAIWYQQYKQNSLHNWHVHSDMYTGVYYLEYPSGAPATELYDNKLKSPNVSEGDVVMFPSITPHRSPKVINDVRKTVISYNFNVNDLNEERLKQLK